MRISAVKQPPLLSLPPIMATDWLKPTQEDASLMEDALREKMREDVLGAATVYRFMAAVGVQPHLSKTNMRRLLAEVRRGDRQLQKSPKVDMKRASEETRKSLLQELEDARSGGDGTQVAWKHILMRFSGMLKTVTEDDKRLIRHDIERFRQGRDGYGLAQIYFYMKVLRTQEPGKQAPDMPQLKRFQR